MGEGIIEFQLLTPSSVQTVVFGGVDADSSVGTAEGTPRVGLGLNAVSPVHIALVNCDSVCVGGEIDHRVRAAVTASKLDKVAGASRGKQVLNRTVALAGKTGQTAHEAGVGCIDADLIVVRFALRGPNVISK